MKNYSRLFAWLGLLGGVYWPLLITVFSPDWGPPGTSRYLEYEVWNRAWPPGLLLMMFGWLGFGQHIALNRAGLWLNILGFALMVIGNIAEFWIFTSESYTGVGRNLSWSTFLFGWLFHLLGALIWGVSGLRSRGIPAWCAWLLILLLPVSFVLLVTQMVNPASAVAVIVLSAWVIRDRSADRSLPSGAL